MKIDFCIHKNNKFLSDEQVLTCESLIIANEMSNIMDICLVPLKWLQV